MPASASLARIRGAEFGATRAASNIHSTSLLLRDTGAFQTWATRSFGKAFLITKTPFGVSTFQMSDATPPVSGVKIASEEFARPLSRRNFAIISSSTVEDLFCLSGPSVQAAPTADFH